MEEIDQKLLEREPMENAKYLVYLDHTGLEDTYVNRKGMKLLVSYFVNHLWDRLLDGKFLYFCQMIMKICVYYFLMYDVQSISNVVPFVLLQVNKKKLSHHKYCKMVIHF